MSDLKPQTESLESLLSTAIGLLMGNKERIGYKPGSVVDKFVDECVERLKDWPYTTSAQPAQSVPLLTDDEISQYEYCLAAERDYERYTGREMLVVEGAKDFARAIESLVRSKLGAGVPMRGDDIYRIARRLAPKVVDGMVYVPEWIVPLVRAVEESHGIVGKEGA